MNCCSRHPRPSNVAKTFVHAQLQVCHADTETLKPHEACITICKQHGALYVLHAYFYNACPRSPTNKGAVSEQLCLTEMKRISMVAWEHLVARCGGGPEFGPSDVCTVCLVDMLDAVASADEQGQAREGALAIAEGLDEQETNSASVSYGYYVSKTWLQ